MYKISVIIPVYNAENTLNRAIDSILNQKWAGNIINDIEIILVDDCSTDNSMNILKQYANKYSNIKIYSTKNNTGMPSKGRNIGIEKSNSEYIMFMDNDDAYCNDLCQTLFEVITKEKADIVTCNYCNINQKTVTKTKSKMFCEKINYKDNYIIFDSYNALLFNDYMIWSKIFKKSVIVDNNIKFPHKVGEDIFFCINAYSKITKMIYIENYYGVKRYVLDDSLSTYPNPNNIINTIKSANEIQELLNSYIDFNKNPKYKYFFPRYIIEPTLIRILRMQNISDLKTCLKGMYDFENEVIFNNSLNDKILKFINYFIIKNHIFIAILLIKISQIFRKSKFLKKIYRILK